MPESHKFTINHSVTGKTEETAAAAAVRSRREADAATVRARRKQIAEQAKLDAAGVVEQEPAPSEQMPTREDIDTIDVTLRDGRIVTYGPPRGISTQDRIVRMFSGRSPTEGGPDPGVTEFRLTKLLLGVRAIDGRSVSCNDLVQRTRLANQLGDEAIEFLFYYDKVYWPPLTAAELPAIKKNYRTPPSGGQST